MAFKKEIDKNLYDLIKRRNVIELVSKKSYLSVFLGKTNHFFIDWTIVIVVSDKIKTRSTMEKKVKQKCKTNF